jgi:nicotinamide mononucleotide transporter
MQRKDLLRPDVAVGLLCALGLVVATERRLLGSYGPSGQVEVAAVVLYAASVWLAVKRSVLTWPTGIAATGLYLYLFGEWRLYADAGLQLVFIAFSAWGWLAWSRGEERAVPPVRRIAPRHLVGVLLLVGAGTAVVRAYLAEVDGAAPLWDALLTSGSLGALYLLIRGYVETWWFWIVLDLAYVALFWSRELYLSATLYALLLAMAARAALEWHSRLRAPASAPAAA